MLILGLISLLQIIFIPGFILVNLLKIKTDNGIQKWLYIFSFSLYCNYGLVTILTLLSLYTIFALWGILIIEIIVLTFLYRSELLNIFSEVSFRDAYFKYRILLRVNPLPNNFIILAAGLLVLFYIAVSVGNIGTIFYFIDTVNNYEWNQWAIDFANNILPKYSFHFPQLIPANWSICYVMIDKPDVHFFPKAIMPLFFFNILLIYIDLAFTKKSPVFLLGLIIYGLFAPVIYYLVFLVDGSADLPVAFFSFLTFHSFIKNMDNSFDIRQYLITFLFASMAAATKLAGFYTFTIAALILGYILFQQRNKLNFKTFTKIFFVCISLSIISLFWYFRTPGEMISGLHQPQYLPKTNYFGIGIYASKLMYYNLGFPAVGFFIITILASLFNKKIRYISIVMVIIPTIIWMFKYSADFRNLSFVIPYLSFTSAAGLALIMEKFSKKDSFSLQLVSLSEVSKTNAIQYSLTARNKIVFLSVSLISGVLILLFTSDKFYSFLLNIYEFIHKYYFLSHRLVYFTEYGFLLHVDFYQRVIVTLSIIIILIPVFILTRIHLRHIILLSGICIVFFNFTVMDKESILNNQKQSFDKVDARNYYEWLKMYINNEKLKYEIETNFVSIIKEKKPREITFIYTGDISKIILQDKSKNNKQLFLKMDLLNSEIRDIIKQKIKNDEYKLIFNDEKFIFFVIKSTVE